MRRTLVALVVLALSIPFLPAGSAESASAEYAGSGSVNVLGVSFHATIACCDLDGNGDYEYGFGSVVLEVSGFYQHVIVRATDEIYGTQPALGACLVKPGATGINCFTDGMTETCGTIFAYVSDFSTQQAGVFMTAVYVTDALEFCGATAGTVTGDFF